MPGCNQDARSGTEPDRPLPLEPETSGPPRSEPLPLPPGSATWSDPAAAPPDARTPEPAVDDRIRSGLTVWLGIVLLFGLGGLLLGQVELALLAALAGLFAVAQAADRDSRWTTLYNLLAWVVPAGGLMVFASMAAMLAMEGAGSGPERAAIGFAIAGAAISGLTAVRPIAAGVASVLFHTPHTTHTMRLAGRMVLMGLLFGWPGWWLFRRQAEMLAQDNGLLGFDNLSSGLIGLCLIALGGVGFRVPRTFRATLERLGLRAPNFGDLAWIVAGVGALFVFNAGAERFQQLRFPELYRSDHEITQMMAGQLSRGETLLLGLSAGVGEEVSLRGALQPRLGLILTSILFAALHVQYSWYGMAVILVLGILLGWIRQRASTTTAVMVHGLYDIVAVMTMQPTG
jgi:hypothetical protein